ncbi:P1 family peptidase [Pusillimonas sp. ANT_WB101]|uniref:DmpA family aminopeptidase n=1 Tax=Pusillimonas sp. ANT_WB101 TaxID=2597356 RepID=UPI0011EF8E5B|nr:P1 family peptidase [Pusillimonas sp. ANT_WB101]KAA0911004.1 P1 family peptidase [Pusillimonas sp. ANT_WB101]
MKNSNSFEAPRVGRLPLGKRNSISDVQGVTVGHATLCDGNIQTGVTVIRPHDGDLFLEKTPAAACIINGFGKSVGLIQVHELGVVETPIALTNTFSVGQIATAQLRQAIAQHPQIGREWPTANPLVLECNDGYLNDIQAFSVNETHYHEACLNTAPNFQQGAVGAGRGMSSFHLKGGIGSASRIAACTDGQYTVGALVLANFGRLSNLIVAGQPLGADLAAKLFARAPDDLREQDKGSIIIVLATDAPLDTRQLGRVSKRAAAGLARTGSVYGHGSGDIALAFSNAYRIPALASQPMPALAMLHETELDALFEATAEATEQAIVNALWSAATVTGRDGHRRRAITELLPNWRAHLAVKP